MGQGFYTVKFDNPEEYFFALIGGPWFMFQYHLAVMQWRPNFRKQCFKLEKMFIWAQFTDLLMEYFSSDALFKMANLLEDP